MIEETAEHLLQASVEINVISVWWTNVVYLGCFLLGFVFFGLVCVVCVCFFFGRGGVVIGDDVNSISFHLDALWLS